MHHRHDPTPSLDRAPHAAGSVSTEAVPRDRGQATTEYARRDRGQASTEYALILLAAALVAVLVIGWATAGGGAAAIGRLFDTAIDAAIDQLG